MIPKGDRIDVSQGRVPRRGTSVPFLLSINFCTFVPVGQTLTGKAGWVNSSGNPSLTNTGLTGTCGVSVPEPVGTDNAEDSNAVDAATLNTAKDYTFVVTATSFSAATTDNTNAFFRVGGMGVELNWDISGTGLFFIRVVTSLGTTTTFSPGPLGGNDQEIVTAFVNHTTNKLEVSVSSPQTGDFVVPGQPFAVADLGNDLFIDIGMTNNNDTRIVTWQSMAISGTKL